MVGGKHGRWRPQPQVAVQVKLNPDGNLLRFAASDLKKQRQNARNRSRARQDRALQMELELERERQARRSQSNERRSGDHRKARPPGNIERQEQRPQRVQLLDDGIRTPGSDS